MASVELKGLGKRYGAAVAVDDVSLRIEHGQLVCLLGPSGCGKTTTLRLIAGFIEPSAGEIVVGDKVLSSAGRTVPPEGRNMSMIFQSYALWPHMTVAENVAYGLRIRKMDKATIDTKLKAILSTARLEALGARVTGSVSRKTTGVIAGRGAHGRHLGGVDGLAVVAPGAADERQHGGDLLVGERSERRHVARLRGGDQLHVEGGFVIG